MSKQYKMQWLIGIALFVGSLFILSPVQADGNGGRDSPAPVSSMQKR